MNVSLLVHLTDDLAFGAVSIGTDSLTEEHLKVTLGLASEVEAGSFHDSINGVDVIPDAAPSSSNLKCHW